LALTAIAGAPVNDGAADAEAIAIPDTTDIGWRNSATFAANASVMSGITGTLARSGRIRAKDVCAPMGTVGIPRTTTALNFVSEDGSYPSQTNDADRCRENGFQSVAP
jgi:hypothetical protein